MYKQTIAAAALLAAAGSAGAAEFTGVPGEFSANVGLATDYTFRGISQTDGAPAIQGGFDWSMEAGGVTPYVGTWGSNVDFGGGETLELDVYGGVRGSLGPLGWDVGLIYYAYPGAGEDYNFFEAALALSYAPIEMLELTAGYAFSPNYFWESGKAHYVSGGATLAPGLPWDIALTATVGHQWIADNAQFGTPDYLDWSVGVSAEVAGFTLSATYVDTNLSRNECFQGADLCGARGILAVSRSF